MFRADAMSLQLAGTRAAAVAIMELLILPLALLGGVVVLVIIGVVLRKRHGKPVSHDAEYETLRARYVGGEISRTVYDRRRRELQQRARTRRIA
jgi:uncharacterized membrane protein